MRLSEFDYTLPADLIAQHPSRKRDECRLMVLDRKSRSISHKKFSDIAGYLSKGDLLILNDTKVIPARMYGKRKTGGRVEIFLLEKRWPVCEALVRPSMRLKEGEKILLETGDEVEILSRGEVGRFVKFFRSIDEIIAEAGHVPLPPYIARDDEPIDREYYQTVFAQHEGATASPTAGLHFTEELLGRVKGQGSRVGFVTLHTNYGTFAPVKCDDLAEHKMHKEEFVMPSETITAVREAKRRGNKVFAVGTTSVRVMEHCADVIGSGVKGQGARGVEGKTDLFIYPGYKFKVVDHMITNFHLPKSTLLLLVSAFAGKDFMFEAYRKAIEMKYRFYSYGDAMMIL